MEGRRVVTGEQDEGPDHEGVAIDLARAASEAGGTYSNRVLAQVNDHVIRMSVMTEPFHWHRHPNSDETFLVIEGEVLLETETERITLAEGQMTTVPAGVAHVTSPATERSVNLTVELADMRTERVKRGVSSGE